MSSDDSDDALQLIRVEINPRKADQLRGAFREMLSGYPYLGSIASSDSIAYHGVRTPAFRWCATDGVSILLNDTPDGFFSNPGHVPVSDDIPANVAKAAGVVPGAIIPPNPFSDKAPMTDDERLFGLAHEICHIACEDVLWAETWRQQGWVPVPRSDAAPEGRLPWDEESFQLAADAGINSGLVADGIGKPPKGCHFDPEITWDTPRNVAYAITYGKKPKTPPPPPGGGKPCPKGAPGPSKANQGSGDVLRPGQAGDPFSDSTDPTNPDTQPGDPRRAAEAIEQGRAEREAMHKRAQEVARQMGAGSSAIEQMVSKAREPMVDWKSYVHGFLSRAGGSTAWDWKRPAKPPFLRAEPYFSPSRGGHGVGHIVVWCDTSGSIGPDETRVYLGVVAEMVSDLNPKELTIGFCDSRVQRVDRDVDTDDSFESYNIPRGGGTDLRPPFEWVAKNLGEEDACDAMIYLTDFIGSAPTTAPPYPVLWCIVGGATKAVSGGNFGEVIPIPVSDLNP